MTLSSAELKRQILMAADKSEFKKRIDNVPAGLSEGDYIEMGNELEALTKTKGWSLVETYMIRRMNLVGLVLSDKEIPDQKGIAKGYIELMQWVQLMIVKRDEIIQKDEHGKARKTQEAD